MLDWNKAYLLCLRFEHIFIIDLEERKCKIQEKYKNIKTSHLNPARKHSIVLVLYPNRQLTNRYIIFLYLRWWFTQELCFIVGPHKSIFEPNCHLSFFPISLTVAPFGFSRVINRSFDNWMNKNKLRWIWRLNFNYYDLKISHFPSLYAQWYLYILIFKGDFLSHFITSHSISWLSLHYSIWFAVFICFMVHKISIRGTLGDKTVGCSDILNI